MSFILSVVSSFFLITAETGSGIEQSPRALVHLLDYLSKDYPGAVSEKAEIIDQAEYAEQIEFSEMAVKLSQSLGKDKVWKEFAKRTSDLQEKIKSHSSSLIVSQLASALKEDVLKTSKISLSPKIFPSRKVGEKLYAAQCTTCHGVSGHGDGPAAEALEPKPRNFHDQAAIEIRSPFENYNVIRLGIPGTGMAAYKNLTEEETWALAFYVQSLRFKQTATETTTKFSLEDLASLSDLKIKEKISAKDDDEKNQILATLRLKSSDDNDSASSGGAHPGIQIANERLSDSEKAFEAGQKEKSLNFAAMAYLDGVELVEPQLRAFDANFVSQLELAMADVRSAISKNLSRADYLLSLSNARAQLTEAQKILDKSSQVQSPWMIFSLASGIVFREGFEAVLIILAILGVVRAARAPRAQRFVHGGWISAIFLGFLCWAFSGWLMYISGAQRELSEGIASLLAVAVLLYMGFWLHSKTEIKRWTTFIDTRVRNALEGSSRWGLFGLAFVAVFREAIETVLFLRALLLQGGENTQIALLSAVILTLFFIILLAWGLLRFSLRLPIRQLFAISSWVMVALSIILVGKALHSFQEVGMVSMTSIKLPFSLPSFFGFYSTFETLIAQAVVFLLCGFVWYLNQHRGSTTSS